MLQVLKELENLFSTPSPKVHYFGNFTEMQPTLVRFMFKNHPKNICTQNSVLDTFQQSL